MDRQSLRSWSGMPEVSAGVWNIAERVVGHRRHAHRHPEVSFEERQTQAWLHQTLGDFGIRDVQPMAGTGLRAVVRGGRPGRTVLWRADIDALPIVEEVSAPYTSANPGTMHACGHDSHIAVALGLAQMMQEASDTLAGNVVFAFQPAEEMGGGARPMIEDGVLDAPDVEAVFGFHADSSLRAGTIAASPGHFMASPGSFELVIRGSGGHAGLPHRSVDPIVCAAHVITALQTIVSRNVHPDHAAVVSIGQIHAGTRGNIIPDEVRISGTVRAFDAETFSLIEGRMQTVLKGVTEAFGATYELTYREGLPTVVNDRHATELVCTVAEGVLGAAGVLPDRTTMSDDFALFLQARPGCYFLLGVGNEAWGITEPNHSPRWDLDERALLVGLEIGRQTLLRALAK